MHKISSWLNSSLAVCLTIISFWWIFFIFWRIGFIQLVQRVAFSFDEPIAQRSTVSRATIRALEYATKGSTQTEDIFFTNSEVDHLLDVHALYEPMRVVLGVGALISFLCLILVLVRLKTLNGEIFWVARNILFVFSVIVLTAILVFPSFFIKFHEMFFPQGNWSFPASSILIQIFPETFWKLMLVCFLISLIIFVGIFHLASQEVENE